MSVEMQQEIKNIVFDLGGVLCGLDADRCVAAFHGIGAEDIAYFVEEHRVEDLFLDAELGHITTAEFCDEVRRLTRKSIQDDAIVWAWNELLTGVSESRKECLLQLSEHYRLFILSNTNDMHWGRCSQEFFRFSQNGHHLGVGDVFEKVFLSYEMHLAKPSEEIFQQVLSQAQLVPEETLFIDDSQANCLVAARLGIHTYHNHHIDDWMSVVSVP